MSAHVTSKTNRYILGELQKAPDSHLSEEWKKALREFDGNDDELVAIFTRIHNAPDQEAAPSIKDMVDPQFANSYKLLQIS
jgi:hypothetical protein